MFLKTHPHETAIGGLWRRQNLKKRAGLNPTKLQLRATLFEFWSTRRAPHPLVTHFLCPPKAEWLIQIDVMIIIYRQLDML